MTPIRNLALVSAALAALGACSAPEPTKTAEAPTTAAETIVPASSTVRVRGTLQALTGDTMTVQTWDGRTVSVPVAADTRFVWVVASSLSTLKDGDFVGTATTGPKDDLRAVELVIFPESMRGAGEGHYPWDTPGVIAAQGGTPAASSAMTNGTVESQSAMTNGTVESQSMMTNGTVASSATASGGRTLTITYQGGTADVTIPDGVPVVRFEPTERASLAVGQKVYAVIPAGATTVGFLAMGKDGIVPPM